MKALAAGCTGVALAALAAHAPRATASETDASRLALLRAGTSGVAGAMTSETATAFKDASGYSNYYEFDAGKGDPARHAHALVTDPWSVEIEGLVGKPGRIGLEDLMKIAPLEERIYRLRCVEA